MVPRCYNPSNNHYHETAVPLEGMQHKYGTTIGFKLIGSTVRHYLQTRFT